MINIYKTFGNGIKEVSEVTSGCWINVVNPTLEEVEFISKELNIDPDFINSALDEEERSRIEHDKENEHYLILVDTPYESTEHGNSIYETIPIAIVMTADSIVTICLKESLLLRPFLLSQVKTFFTHKKARFILQILYRNATIYLNFLRLIDKKSVTIENQLHKSTKNKELIKLLSLEKSLVYFSTSLKSNELVMEKLLRYDFIKKYDDDMELLEDTIIENKQAIEMAKIYSNILSGTMDAFASIISNNLNITMTVLASLTIIMAIPSIISGFFGMNVLIPLQDNVFAFYGIILISFIICFIVIKVMKKKRML